MPPQSSTDATEANRNGIGDTTLNQDETTLGREDLDSLNFSSCHVPRKNDSSDEMSDVPNFHRDGLLEKEVTKSSDVDGGWAWVVFFAGFFQFFISSGMYYSFSVFFVELLQTFDESRAKTGWVYSTNSAVHMFCGPLGGFVIVRWGPRAATILGGIFACLGYILTAFAPNLNVVFITYSFINAIGTSLNFSGWIVGLARFWNRHHALVVGLVMSGSGCGVFLLGHYMESIVSYYGWRGAMIICGGLSLNFCVFGATIYKDLRKPTVNMNQVCMEHPPLISRGTKREEYMKIDIGDFVASADEKNSSLRAAKTDGDSQLNELSSEDDKCVDIKGCLRILWVSCTCKEHNSLVTREDDSSKQIKNLLYSPKFWLLEASCFLSFMATTTLFAVFLDWTRWKGLSSSFPRALAGSGAGDLVGRLFAGVLMGRGIPPLVLFSGIQLLLATTIGCAALAHTSSGLIASMVGFGVACGLQSVLYALMPSQLSSGVSMARVLGYLLLVTGAGALSGPPIAGMLVDLTNSYNPVMLLCTVAPAIAAILNFAAHFTT